MKELLTLYAKYNYETNLEIKRLISGLDEEVLEKERDTYYGSIKGLVRHITHQVHHQGQLSQLLDELRVEHEFGNIFPLLPDSTPSS